MNVEFFYGWKLMKCKVVWLLCGLKMKFEILSLCYEVEKCLKYYVFEDNESI